MHWYKAFYKHMMRKKSKKKGPEAKEKEPRARAEMSKNSLDAE